MALSPWLTLTDLRPTDTDQPTLFRILDIDSITLSSWQQKTHQPSLFCFLNYVSIIADIAAFCLSLATSIRNSATSTGPPLATPAQHTFLERQPPTTLTDDSHDRLRISVCATDRPIHPHHHSHRSCRRIIRNIRSLVRSGLNCSVHRLLSCIVACVPYRCVVHRPHTWENHFRTFSVCEIRPCDASVQCGYSETVRWS